ncbi:MAG: hypothetical protein ACRDJW_11175 [Thermomicrobiales bacterium]
MSDGQSNRDEIEEIPADPVAPEDVASAARSCFVIVLVGAALVVVVGLYLVLGWVF